MALEISLLNQNVICELLDKNYGIFPISVQKLKLGSANCYRVFDGEKYYFLKEFQSFFSEDQIIREAKLLEFLSSSDIPTAQFYKTLNGEYVIKYQDRLICLQNYIEGVSYGYYDLPSDMLPLAARMLGKIHNALKDYDLPEHRSGEWISSFCAEDVIRQYDSLIEIAKKKSDDKNTLKINLSNLFLH